MSENLKEELRVLQEKKVRVEGQLSKTLCYNQNAEKHIWEMNEYISELQGILEIKKAELKQKTENLIKKS